MHEVKEVKVSICAHKFNFQKEDPDHLNLAHCSSSGRQRRGLHGERRTGESLFISPLHVHQCLADADVQTSSVDESRTSASLQGPDGENGRDGAPGAAGLPGADVSGAPDAF